MKLINKTSSSLMLKSASIQLKRSKTTSIVNMNRLKSISTVNDLLKDSTRSKQVIYEYLNYYAGYLASSITERIPSFNIRTNQNDEKKTEANSSRVVNAKQTEEASKNETATSHKPNPVKLDIDVQSVSKAAGKPIVLKDETKSLIPKVSATFDSTELSYEEKLLNLCDSIEKASSLLLKSKLINDLFMHLYENSDIRHVIYRKNSNIIKHLLELSKNSYTKQDKLLMGRINECLALLGYIDKSSIKHAGINILSLDGGGAKGFVTIEVLKNIQKYCDGKPIHEIFDYICGVSTGAVLASLLGIYKLSLEECERQYKLFIREIFQRNRAAGMSNLLMSHAYYDTKLWERMLQESMGDTLVINSAKNPNACKISLVTNLTTPNQMKIFLFRNYNLPTWAQSHYEGTTRGKVWEALRASSAAPGYYEEFKLDGQIFHDGGLLANNPTAIALHEAKQLWPSKNDFCIVSIGNGQYKPTSYSSSKAASISLKQKINRIVAGISYTENVHTVLLDLLPPKTYFRFNPYMSEEFHLDENRPVKFKSMQYETNMYVRRNEFKFRMLAKQLQRPKNLLQRTENFLINKLVENSLL